ncbi:hypothetical protein CANINC_004947 [Pichia inconspicua]|uniref:Calcium-binding protein NCS-1 n=1 Tax=Pichia inconspicua TaxID=52247 RepID=A0A4T0WW62_9ASCO|nr:hypothetical protein CANINC_004947 [[Candida] inconspicua]
MGQKTSKLSSEDMASLRAETRFSSRELHQWYKGFRRDVPGGELTKDEFIKIHRQFYPFGDATEFANYAFDAMDMSGTGRITFSDFMRSLSVASRGTVEEKLAWSFQMYDRDRDGLISYKDLLSVIKSIYRMIGTQVVKFDENELTPELKADLIWEGYGKDIDERGKETGYITLEEWSDSEKVSDSVINAINVYSDLI